MKHSAMKPAIVVIEDPMIDDSVSLIALAIASFRSSFRVR